VSRVSRVVVKGPVVLDGDVTLRLELCLGSCPCVCSGALRAVTVV